MPFSATSDHARADHPKVEGSSVARGLVPRRGEAAGDKPPRYRRLTASLVLGTLILIGAACSSATAQPSPTSAATVAPASASTTLTSTPATATAAPSAATIGPPSPTSAPSPATAASVARSQPIRVVAAENFYGDLATQIGGERVHVVSLLSDPNADPHEYESNADDAKAVADAQVIIKNNLGYDAFIDKLMAASPRPNRIVLDASQITGHHEGDNPHIWYDPTTMPKVAQQLAATLTKIDPADQGYFASRFQAFGVAEQAVNDRVSAMRGADAGVKVLTTEPVFDYMAEALGLNVVDQDGAFQRAVAEGNDPPAASVAQFQKNLTSRAVKALIYNRQTVTPITTQLQGLAAQNHVPVVPVSETEPAGKTYQQWMLDELTGLQGALGGT